MIGWLYIIGLALAAVAVSILGAAFSVSGLARLFSGSPMAIILMSSSLEFAKFMVAAFLHRTWSSLNFFYKAYLVMAVVLLSLITSMGIFGFLSDAYQSAATILTESQIKMESLKEELKRNDDEVARLKKSVEEIPINLISKKLKARKEIEPALNELLKKSESINQALQQQELSVVEVKSKVGPLIYISRIFSMDIDTVVKWLIMVFVLIFDPLAICLVIATGEAMKLKSYGLLDGGFFDYPSSTDEPHVVEVPENPDLAEPIKMRFVDAGTTQKEELKKTD